MKLKVLVALICAVVFANVAGADYYNYQSKINLGELEGYVSSNQTAFDEAKRVFDLDVNNQTRADAYSQALDSLNVAKVAYESGKVLFKSFLNLLGRLSFAKAQGKSFVARGIRTDLVSNYLTDSTSVLYDIEIK
ncbi:MAG: hypothetical protein LBK92_02880 [Endomicrobium sp.]|jgi:hypothetical protein|nr:hypothetical protein [Endomicrobium sp.]